MLSTNVQPIDRLDGVFFVCRFESALRCACAFPGSATIPQTTPIAFTTFLYCNALLVGSDVLEHTVCGIPQSFSYAIMTDRFLLMASSRHCS